MHVMRNIGRGIAGILVVPSIALIVICAFTLAIVPAMANPENIKTALAEQEIYEDVVPSLLPALLDANRNVETGFPLAFTDIRDNMSPDDWRAVANDLVPPPWVQTQFETALTGFYAYLDGAPTISYQLDLEPLAARLAGVEGERAARRITSLARPCQPDEINFIRELDQVDVETIQLPVCSPIDPDDELTLREAYIIVFEQLASLITEDAEMFYAEGGLGPLGIVERVNTDGSAQLELNLEDSPGDLLDLRVFYQTYELYRPLFFLFPLMMLSLIVTFGVHSLKGFGRWIGIVLMASSVALTAALLMFSAGVITIPGMTPADTDQSDLAPELFELQRDLLEGLATVVYREAGETIMSPIFYLGFLGIGLLVVSFVARGPERIVRLRDDTVLAPSDG
jgi:hypothetical protein